MKRKIEKEVKVTMSIYTEKYSEKSFVVRGDTKSYKPELKNLGGKYNGMLKGGSGWIFSSKKQEEVDKFIASLTKEEDGKSSTESAEASEKEDTGKKASKRPLSAYVLFCIF